MTDLAYDTYIIVGVQQPFTIFRVDTTAESARKVREHIQMLVTNNATGSDTYDPAETFKFFVQLEFYLTLDDYVDDDETEQDSEDFGVLEDLIPNRNEWKREFKDRWTPMWCDWTSANTLILGIQ